MILFNFYTLDSFIERCWTNAAATAHTHTSSVKVKKNETRKKNIKFICAHNGFVIRCFFIRKKTKKNEEKCVIKEKRILLSFIHSFTHCNNVMCFYGMFHIIPIRCFFL